MFDNGLLKYYQLGKNKNGFLNSSDINLKEEQRITPKVKKCSSSVGTLYKRIGSGKTFNKRLMDSQILLSQIYNRAGLQSAIYLPAQTKGNKFLVSNSVETPQTILASDYIESFPKYQYRFPLDFLNKRHSGETVEKYFTERAIAQQTKMRVYDAVCFNNDRHYANFFYKLQEGKADDVVGIDFEIGSCAESRGGVTDAFFSDFVVEQMPRQELLQKFSEDESFAEVIDKQALAEEIGSINPFEVAQDIKQTINYDIDPALPELLSQSCEEVADCLIK